MDRDEILKILEGRVSDYYYNIAVTWTKRYEKKLFFKRKFYLEPTLTGRGYILLASNFKYIVLC